MNFMTRSGLNQQMQGEYRVLLLALSHPILSGSWQRMFYGLKFMIRDFFSGKKILACILFGSYDFARDLWGFQKIRKDFWYKINEEKSPASGKVEIFWRKMYP